MVRSVFIHCQLYYLVQSDLKKISESNQNIWHLAKELTTGCAKNHISLKIDLFFQNVFELNWCEMKREISILQTVSKSNVHLGLLGSSKYNWD